MPNAESREAQAIVPTPKKRKGRVARIPYPVPDTGLPEIPADFNPSKHLPLSEEDFEEPKMFHEMKIRSAERTIAFHKKRIEFLEMFHVSRSSREQLKAAENLQTSITDAMEKLGLSPAQLLAVMQSLQPK